MKLRSILYRSYPLALLLAMLVTLSGCETLGPSEHGVVFSSLPPFLGGGVHDKVYAPKQKVPKVPWWTLYKMDTGLQTISWGSKGEGDNKDLQDSVQTRALDGNEVALSMTVTYRVMPELLAHVIQKVGIDQESIRRLVTAVARSEMRTHMNFLHTGDFQMFEARQRRVEEVRAFMNQRLKAEGIEIVDVIFERGLFYRERADGTVDASYQDQINETEQMNQRTEQERNRSKTVEEEMKQKFAEAEGAFFKVREQGDSMLRQAEERGKARHEALLKDAERIAAVGTNEIEGMKKEIEALSGPGGKALLRKEIARALVARDPKFVVLSPSTGQGSLEVNRTDTNELLRDAGIFEALRGPRGPGASRPADGQSAAPNVPAAAPPTPPGDAPLEPAR